MLHRFFIVIFSLFVGNAARAQYVLGKYEIGITAGTLLYAGDLAPQQVGSVKTPRFVFGISGSRYLSNTLALRLDVSHGGLRGNDAAYANPEWRRQRAFAFDARITEAALLGVWSRNHNRRLKPYLFAGLGAAFTRIRPDYSGFNADFFSNEPDVATGLAQDAARTPPRFILVLPLGAGVQYRITTRWAIGVEGGTRLMKSDYLDGVSKAANPARSDYYNKLTLGLHYNLGGKNKLNCPATVR